MTTRAETYALAAGAYLKPAENRYERVQEISSEIRSFMHSDVWTPALHLLKVTGYSIPLGGSSARMSEYTLTGSGFCRNGEEYIKDKIFATDSKIHALAAAFYDFCDTQSSFFQNYVYSELDRLVEACPK